MATAQKSRSNPRSNRRRLPPDAGFPERIAETKIQLGARISEAKYHQLKLATVLHRVTVQVLVEQAIAEFLTNHPELLQSRLVTPHPANRRHDGCAR